MYTFTYLTNCLLAESDLPLHAVQRRIWRWHECDIELDFQSVSVSECMPVLFRVANMNAFASESGDHGAMNSWDRTAYLSDVKYGYPSYTAAMNNVEHNFIIANYGASQVYRPTLAPMMSPYRLQVGDLQEC